MKHLTKPIALLLCAAMLLGLAGCNTPPAGSETTPPTEPTPTEPPAAEVYASARAALDSASDVTLDISVVTTTTVADQMFTEASEQTLTYAGLGTDALQVALEEIITFGIHLEKDEEDEEEDDEDNFATYSEIYADGTVYATLEVEDSYTYSGALTAEECAARYLPVVLLDAALYGDVTAAETGTGTTITFSAPTAAESWAIPAEAELLDASGSAVINASGVLEQMNYTVTYRYGPAEIKLEVESKPQASVKEITVPADPEEYPALQYLDALRLMVQAPALLVQADTISISNIESATSQAAGIVRNQSTSMDMSGRDEDMMTKVETSIYMMDYSTNQSQELEQEEVYRDGEYTVTVDNTVPTSQTGISHEDILEYCYQIAVNYMVSMEYWEDVTVTDLGSLYLLEFDYNTPFGNTMQNSVCTMLLGDPTTLNRLATAYANVETTGYLGIDKYTGLPTSAGFYYEGAHTIEGTDYTLTVQADQSIEAPGLGAYYAITEEMPAEAEPETKPTPAFYHVTGDSGQEMWLLGTIHVGDERTAYLPQEIYDAFAASDALALEINSKAFEEQVEEDEDVQDQVSEAYYYSDGTTIESLMEEADYARAVQYMKATGNYSMNAPYMKPYLWSNSIDNFYLRQTYAIHGDQGVEERLHTWAEDLDKEIREVESSLFQIRMSTGYSTELQLLMLEDSMEYTYEEYVEDLTEMYDKWCQGDEAALRELINEEVDTSEMTEEELAEYEAELPLVEEYEKAMNFDRNEGMLKVAIEYLESGDVVFYAVGLAHLLDDTNGLVDALREAGYTVEQVTYA